VGGRFDEEEAHVGHRAARARHPSQADAALEPGDPAKERTLNEDGAALHVD